MRLSKKIYIVNDIIISALWVTDLKETKSEGRGQDRLFHSGAHRTVYRARAGGAVEKSGNEALTSQDPAPDPYPGCALAPGFPRTAENILQRFCKLSMVSDPIDFFLAGGFFHVN